MNWSYIAGFFDGDGCVSIDVRQQKVYLIMSQKDVNSDVLDDMAIFLEARGITCCMRISKHRVCNLVNLSNTTNEGAHQMLKCLVKHLIVKQDKAQQALHYLDDLAAIRKKHGVQYWRVTGSRVELRPVIIG